MNRYSARVGSIHFYKGGIIHRIAKIISHEQYVPKFGDSDIALIKLSTPIKFNDNVMAIRLASSPLNPKKTGMVSGWGNIEPVMTVDSTSDVLLYAEIPIFDRERCQPYLPFHLSENMICAGEPSAGACVGDSGGPLTQNGELVGIVSQGVNCYVSPSVYTNVFYFKSWIEENMY